jgi:hypothetical protein
LLDTDVAAFIANERLQVAFTLSYDGGRWSGRKARTQKSWLIVDPPGPPGPHEVALVWTDNKAQRRSANVHVSFLQPVRPVLGGKALIIAGQQSGKVVTILKRKRAEKRVTCRAEWHDGRNQELLLSEADLCRIDDDEIHVL